MTKAALRSVPRILPRERADRLVTEMFYAAADLEAIHPELTRVILDCIRKIEVARSDANGSKTLRLVEAPQ